MIFVLLYTLRNSEGPPIRDANVVKCMSSKCCSHSELKKVLFTPVEVFQFRAGAIWLGGPASLEGQ